MKGIMSTALKDNTSLQFSVVTGCLRIAKESVFTGTNNFVTDSITDSRYNESVSYTHLDVYKRQSVRFFKIRAAAGSEIRYL